MYGNVHSQKFVSILFFVSFFAIPNFISAPAWAAVDSQNDPKIQDASKDNTTTDQMKTKPPVAVTVIGSRLPSFRSSIEDIPANITYKSYSTTFKDKEELDRVQPLTFQESVQDAEGVILFDSVGNNLDTTFGLRGFSDSDATTFLVDGVRVNEVDSTVANYPLLNMNDVEAIQIERGSASAIYGSGAFGGVVNIITRQPGPKPFSAFGSLELSSFDGINFNQGFSGTIDDRVTPLGGKWSYYFNGGRDVSQSEGFRENGEWRITSFDIKSAYTLPEDLGRYYVGVKHMTDAVSNPGEMTFQQFQDDAGRTNKPLDGRDFKNTIVQIGADQRFWDNHILASVMADWRFNLIHFFTTTATFADFPDGFNPDTDLVTTHSRQTDLIWQLKYENQWKEVYNESVIGMEFRDAALSTLEQDAFQGIVVERTARETDLHGEPFNTALFWNETLHFFDKIIPHFGMRHDFHWLNTEDMLTPTQNISRHWNDSTLSAGVTIKPIQQVDVYANYSQGFRVPTINEISPFSGTLSQNLAPEKSDSYEAGTRVRYKELAQLKTGCFLIDTKDEIVFDSTSVSATAPFGQNINIGKSRRYGIETRLDTKPVEELSLYGSYTWTRAYVRETDAGGSLVDGRSLGQVPENRFSIGGYLQPFLKLGEWWDGFKIGLSGIFVGRQHPTSYESAAQATLNATGGAGHFIKAYSVWNLILSYTWREYEIYFKINNLFDEKYYSRSVSATSGGTVIYPAGTFNFVNPGPPREYVLGSKWEF